VVSGEWSIDEKAQGTGHRERKHETWNMELEKGICQEVQTWNMQNGTFNPEKPGTI
jgi:hypothetical protein